jgi:hypothetical protein
MKKPKKKWMVKLPEIRKPTAPPSVQHQTKKDVLERKRKHKGKTTEDTP